MTSYLDNIYYRTTDLHSAFAGKKVFIAGRGFYGSWMVDYFDHLKSKGIDVTCLSLSSRDNWLIEHPETYSDFQQQADFVINCAGAASSQSNGAYLLDAHSLGPISLFRYTKVGARGLQVSTGAINADTPYARAKRVAELSLGLLDLNVQIVRPFATVGPGMSLDSHFAIATFIKRTLAGQTLEVTSAPCHRSFVHITDLIVQMLHVLVNGDGKPYDVGSDSVISVSDAARVISDDVKVVDTQFASNAATDFYVADLSRVEGQFNLDLTYSSEEAIADAYRWFRSVK